MLALDDGDVAGRVDDAEFFAAKIATRASCQQN
jgi:hypothetical protein